LIATIEMVLAQDPPADEVLVIDQTETHLPATQAALEQLADAGKLRYIRQSPANLPAARNRALGETRCEVVIFIDDDVELFAGFVDAHRRAYEADPTIVGVAGRVSRRLPRPQMKPRATWPRFLDYRFFDMDGTDRVEGLSNFYGANHSVRVAQVMQYGGYDTKFAGVALREETDLALRLFLGGEKIIFDPAAHLYHLFAPSGGCRIDEWGDFGIAENLIRFVRKHRAILKSHSWWELWRAFRLGVLNRRNVARPHLLLAKSAYFIFALLGPGKRTLAPKRRFRQI
jgi:GT2 family glycosyltransferase